jgi:ABC-type oligopeptide transport system ATPase subunit
MPVLELRNVSKTFHARGTAPLKAVDDVSIAVRGGECLAIVGESGSGKSTLARIALGLIAPDSGEVLVKGRPLRGASAEEKRAFRLAVQPVFQDPAASFNPRRTVISSLDQALRQRRAAPASSRAEASSLLAQVGLKPAEHFLDRFPHELSGGQRQRLAIARALALDPELIIADEPLSGADVSIRAQILNLLLDLQRSRALAYVLITHDMLVAQAVATRVAVMYRGRIVEEGDTAAVMSAPRDPYTVRLLGAVQSVDADSLAAAGARRAAPVPP